MLILFLSLLHAGEISTNSVSMPNAPGWLKPLRVERLVEKTQRSLEWDIRRIIARWHSDQKEFEKAHGFDASVLAVTKGAENLILLGPKVEDKNFDGIFAHELAHVILFQKYKDAIPKWLEEGLANHVAKRGLIDYAFLASQPKVDVRSLGHPFKSTSSNGVKYHYMASGALIEMISSKCKLADLLQLSVGQKLESYLSTFCRIEDLNAEFQAWVKKRAR